MTDSSVTPQSELLWFRLAALALSAAARESGVAATIQVRVVASGELMVDIGFPPGTSNPDWHYQVLLRHLREHGDLFEAEYRLNALGDHGVEAGQVEQERARWKGRLPVIHAESPDSP
jgi:hypothetical protein